jgi:DNA-binding NarL/FixJ family response regulator
LIILPVKPLLYEISVPIKLILVDSHPVMLEGLKTILNDDHNFDVQKCVPDGESAMDAIKQYQPDVVLMELYLKKMTGLFLINEINQVQPPIRIVVFTGAPTSEAIKAIDLGVQGVVLKDKPKEFLTRCLLSVNDGNQWLDEDLAMKVVDKLRVDSQHEKNVAGVLTRRELAVAKLAMEGLPNKLIAKKLFIEEGTAKLHLHHIYQKLNCSGRVALVLRMQKNGLE